MSFSHPRLKREALTIEAMIRLYCRRERHDHSMGKLCPACTELREYAFQRLTRCPYQHNKPSCQKCTTHCYKPGMRERIRRVMKVSGPRMLIRHPLLVMRHLLDEQNAPPKSAQPQKEHPREKVKHDDKP